MDTNALKKTYVDAFYSQYKDELESGDVVTNAVNLAYKDAQRRMKNIDSKKRDNAKAGVIQVINEYFENKAPSDQEKYDGYHASICNAWCNAFEQNGRLAEQGNYGKAQKIVNMAFKYLYCYYSNRGEKTDFFKYCHYTLDSYTLRWLNGCKGEGKPGFLNGDFKWSSNLIPEKNLDGEYLCSQYDEIQEYARKCVDNIFGEGWSVFEAEFFIWENVIYYDFLKEMLKRRNNHLYEGLFNEDLLEKIKENYPSIERKRGLNDFVIERKSSEVNR
ncbi:MAG: hypothetical protein K5669_01285 [Lachnospiraceae bacterium]|nr:hypothetical protein [Lachnospiraceae bacterium]